MDAPGGKIGVRAAQAECVELRDGGEQAYPRMLAAIAQATRSVHLEVRTFASAGVGARFVDALAQAARRGLAVRVVIDGWGSSNDGHAVAAALREAGCEVVIYNRVLARLVGRFGRNDRKILLVDGDVAFLGGIHFGDGDAWTHDRFARSRWITSVERGSRLRTWLLDPLGLLLGTLAETSGRLLARRKRW